MKSTIAFVLVFAGVAPFVFASEKAENSETGKRKHQEWRELRQRENGKKRKSKMSFGWHVLSQLPKAEQERLKKLYQKNPKEFREQLLIKLKELKEHQRKQQNAFKQLVKSYHSATTTEKKEKYLKQIQAATEKQFHARMEQNRKRLEMLEKKVKQLRKSYEQRKKNADKIIKVRVDNLTRDQNLDW